MIKNLLTKDYIIQHGVEFEEHLEYGGPYGQGVVEFSDEGKEKLFTGLAYDLFDDGNIESYFYVENGVKQGKHVEFYPNGNVKRVGNMSNNSAEGMQVEYFENSTIKYESHCKSGLEMTFIKYDETGKIVEQKLEPSEFDLDYAKKFADRD